MALGIKNPTARMSRLDVWNVTRRAVIAGVLLSGLAVATPSFVFGAQSVTFAWNPVTNANLAGYNIYYGSVSHSYTNVISVGNVTNATISGLVAGGTYYFAATTLSTSGLESGLSDEVSYTVPDAVPMIITEKVTTAITNLITLQFTTNLSSPNWQTFGAFSGSTNLSFTNMPVVFLRGVCSNLTGSVTLTWPPSSNTNVKGYKVYYGVASYSYTSVMDVGKATTATISNLIGNNVYYFAIDTYGILGIVSPYSNEISAAPQINTSFSLALAGP
jgi:hypothetical protein